MVRKSLSAIYKVPVLAMNGESTTLEPYQGQVMLIVNVASRCGFTPQYTELESMYRDYQKSGFVVLGFPCDQFMNQEPGGNQDIKAFAESCFRVTFPLFGKIDVRGKQQAPIYAYLKKHIEKWFFIFIPWNFTKVLVDSEGRVPRRFLPMTSIKTVRAAIEAILPKTK